MAMRAHPVNDRIDRAPGKRPPEPTRTPAIERPAEILQRSRLAPHSLRPTDVLALQRSIGNRAVAQLLPPPILGRPRPIIQPKLTVNAPGDEYEQEADRVAAEVMRMPAVQRPNLYEGEKPAVMTKRAPAYTGGAFEAGEAFEQQLGATREQGQSLPASLRDEFEPKFGVDFSGVRIHTGAVADQLNQSIQAKAFTTGQHVFFRQGAYDPVSRGGQAVIAHELTHVVQQGSATMKTNADGVIQRDGDDDELRQAIQKQRGRAMGMSAEDVEVEDATEEFVRSAGKRDTAEAQNLGARLTMKKELAKLRPMLSGRHAADIMRPTRDVLSRFVRRHTSKVNTAKIIAEGKNKARPESEHVKSGPTRAEEQATRESGVAAWESEWTTKKAAANAAVAPELADLESRGLLACLKWNVPTLKSKHRTMKLAVSVGDVAGAIAALTEVSDAFAEVEPAYSKYVDLSARLHAVGSVGLKHQKKQNNAMEALAKRSIVDPASFLRDCVPEAEKNIVMLEATKERREGATQDAAKQVTATGEFNGNRTTAKLQDLVNRGLIRKGLATRRYKTSYDGGNNYSVEVTVKNLPDIVIHSHCTSDGTPKREGNATHWKLKSQKYEVGASYTLTDGLIDALLDKDDIRSAPRDW